MKTRTSLAPHVLVIDDSFEARQMTRRAFEADSFTVSEAADGRAGLGALAEHRTDVVVLDISMPGMNGLEVLSQIRRTDAVPVVVLSGSADESQRVLAFELGADDYVVKPFLLRELPARTRGILRRAGASAPSRPLQFGELVIRVREREVQLGERLVDTTPREFDLLAKLASEPRRVFTRDELLKDVWGSSLDWQDPATVTEHVRRLRRKIEADPERPSWIRTARGVGYRFEPPQ